MKKTLVGLGVILLVVGGAILLFGWGIKSSNQSVHSLCQAYTIGQKIDFDVEKSRVEDLGLHVTTTIAGEVGPDVRAMLITAPGFEPASCEVQIRDGAIFLVR